MAVAVALTTSVSVAVAAPETSGDSAPASKSISGTPDTTVSKTSRLKVSGETITVSGTGFSGSEPGIYVGLVQDNKFSATDASAWMTTAFIRPTQIIGGEWSTSVDVVGIAGASDCTKNSCSIYTVAAHGSSDRSQDTQTTVTFAAAPTTTTTTTTKPPTTTEDPEPTIDVPVITTTKKPTTPTGGPSVSADRTSGLNAAGDTISISGSGFSTSGTGIYIGIAQSNRYSNTDASVFQDAKFIKPTDMPGGSWSTSLNVSSIFAGSDCQANACAIYTLAAHGSSDRSQDTSTPISFVGTPAPGATTGTGTGTGTGAGTGTGTGAGAIATNSALSVTLSKSTDITPSGETVTISGSGFSGASPGLYVGMVQDNVFSATDASVWMTTAFLKPESISGGNWSTTMELAAVQGNYDCIKNTCSIYTVAAHGSSDRSQDSRTPVGFVGGVAPGTVTAPPASNGAANSGAANTGAVTLSKSSGIKIEGEEITISGTGFSGAQPGIYVGLIQDDKYSTTDAGAWMTTAFILPSKITNGAWSTTMKIMAVKGDSDCTKNTCSIYTVAAHGSSDRSQDTKTPVSFGDNPSEADAVAAGAPGDSNAAIRNLADSFSGGYGWIAPLVVGSLIGAGSAIATAFALRRRT
ncbi:hypothetical protein QM600_05075 [Rhodococcus sp. IEGM 1379]|nr:hypothetical protein [Rhodococcus sp. IEGM 1379]